MSLTVRNINSVTNENGEGLNLQKNNNCNLEIENNPINLMSKFYSDVGFFYTEPFRAELFQESSCCSLQTFPNTLVFILRQR